MANTSLLGSYGGIDGSALMFRNRIINGDMRIDQRNAGASVASLNGYSVDRWFVDNNTNTVGLSTQRSTVAPTGFQNSLSFTVSGTGASPSASNRNRVGQRIEGFNVADLGWGTTSAQSISISFWVRSSLTGVLSGFINNSGGNRSYLFPVTISAANTWEYKTISISGDTTGTWLTDNGSGLQIGFDLGAGSNFTSSSGTWLAGDFGKITGSISLIANSGATLYITGVQLEAGAVATPFERRPIGTELALCQRYYEQIGLRYFGGIYISSTTRFVGTQPVFYKVTKRTSSSQFAIVGGTAYWADSNLIYSATSNTGFTFSGDEFSMFYWQTRQAGGTTPTDGRFVFLENYPTVAVSAEL